MSLKTQINDDLKKAMMEKDAARRDAIRIIQAAIKQVEVDSRKELDDAAVLDVLQTEAKKRREAITNFEQAGRTESAESERFELTLIETYLPKQLTREEIEAEVKAAIAQTGVTSSKEMGKLMGVLMPKVKGRADGKLVNEIVRTLLG
ncbi:MAG: aspartyl-tRNA amidotransferase subunit B [Chloroflexota bacterium]|nr:GatB/YqeY domain-containing protein [Chloroflexota bacterium]NOG65291.1 GatB/YqeY domain-containing protein [Chloroflexota bacterium]GIK66678.1 MAG: aspartyl-tRNA amidotransferase subunit B [Chloroflexota bacterium]